MAWNLRRGRPITSAVAVNPLVSHFAMARIVEPISRHRPSLLKKMARPSSASANEPRIPLSATELTPSFQSNGSGHLTELKGQPFAGNCGRSQTAGMRGGDRRRYPINLSQPLPIPHNEVAAKADLVQALSIAICAYTLCSGRIVSRGRGVDKDLAGKRPHA